MILRAVKIVLGCTLITVLTGCYSARFEDVSGAEKYAHLIGEKYRATKQLLIYGITADRNYKQEVDYYVITEEPGIGGPEVIFGEPLKASTLIQIKKALHCVNCLGERIHFEVEILSNKKYQDHPVNIRDTAKHKIFIEKDGKAFINWELFYKVLE